jgi:hypothetical protein
MIIRYGHGAGIEKIYPVESLAFPGWLDKYRVYASSDRSAIIYMMDGCKLPGPLSLDFRMN